MAGFSALPLDAFQCVCDGNRADLRGTQCIGVPGLPFRNADVETRKKYVQLVESVKANGGKVHVFSSMHVSGERKLV